MPNRKRNRSAGIYPDDLFAQTGFDRILELLASRCEGEEAKVESLALTPTTDLERLNESHEETDEALQLLRNGSHLPVKPYSSVSRLEEAAHITGYVYAEEDLISLRKLLETARDLVAFFQNENEDRRSDRLVAIAHSWPDPKPLLDEINAIFDEEGGIKPNASDELARISARIHNENIELDRSFRKGIADFRKRGWLSDNVESVRNGRRVLSVPAEHKRKIKGIIHDESASGKTVFIEPEAVIRINNRLFELEQEKKREIRRILQRLSGMVAERIDEVRSWYDGVKRFDQIRARSLMASDLNCHKPELMTDPVLSIKNGRHPLLVLKHKGSGQNVVPHDLTLVPPNRILVLSGPNAGGKSVLLKAVGLHQLMWQCGLLPCCGEESKMGIFDGFFADIGDHQSIEDDLSTYSSHLLHMKQFLAQADKSSLVLIDEFGSGTDPRIGGAIAEAVLNGINEKGSWGVVTTHYSNLKMFAYRTEGLVNAALTFDLESLKPTYELQIGKPGSSFAFEIAEKVGLPDPVVANAKQRAGKDLRQVDELLVELQKEKQEVVEKLAEARAQEEQVRRLRENFERMSRELDIKRKKFRIEQKEELLRLKAQQTRQMEEIIGDLKKKEDLAAARVELQEIKKQQLTELEKVREIKKDLTELERESGQREELYEGDRVKLRSGDSFGTINSLEKGKARVEMGGLTLEVPVEELVKVNNPIERNPFRSVKTDLQLDPQSVRSSLDIKGMRRADAEELLEDYLDQVLVANIPTVRILHGRGGGVLKKLLQEKLREYGDKFKSHHPEEDAGGEGVTIVTLK